MYRAKILVLGPCESGKTVISNFLSDATEVSNGEYRPTQGCRILEFEVNNVYVGSRNVTAEIELWDVSGDHKFEGCWPAIARDTNGIVFVYNPDQSQHEEELDTWYTYFAERRGFKKDQCIVFANQKREHQSTDNDLHLQVVHRIQLQMDKHPLAKNMEHLNQITTNLEEEGEACRDNFINYLGDLLTAMTDNRDKEELSIMNDR